ncbi:50S ribosomal protein L6 [Anaerolineales bacterium HSG6]|nr:50S ribosomal protein L6 [Anaerolineales bacterium HSG6]MDM8530073.1 50S ribosomal protein L6 [Anaerolineales bacterium HSG25]
MSRIGRLPVVIPAGVSVKIDQNLIIVKGPKGELQHSFPPEISVKQESGEVIINRSTDHRLHRSKHGLIRALVNNMILGVSKGFTKDLVIEGVGYKAALQGKKLVLNLGYSHPVVFNPQENVSFVVDKSGTQLSVNGIDKALVGEIAARIRRVRPPEPYKGKGVRYANETIIRKAGKTGKAK